MILDGDNLDHDNSKRRRISHDHTSEIDSDNAMAPSIPTAITGGHQQLQVIGGSTSIHPSNTGLTTNTTIQQQFNNPLPTHNSTLNTTNTTAMNTTVAVNMNASSIVTSTIPPS